MILQDVVIGVCVAGLLGLVWQHLSVSQHAYRLVARQTRDRGVNLLDQSVVLRRISLRPSASSLFAIRRVYSFEFATLGDERYPGSIELLGKRQINITLAPFKTETLQGENQLDG